MSMYVWMEKNIYIYKKRGGVEGGGNKDEEEEERNKRNKKMRSGRVSKKLCIV